jgi:hypothetical protein
MKRQKKVEGIDQSEHVVPIAVRLSDSNVTIFNSFLFFKLIISINYHWY